MSLSPRDEQAVMLQLQPQGWTFPSDPNTYAGAKLYGWSNELSLIGQQMDALLPQVDLRVAYDLLPDYQRVLGPDPCGRDLSVLSFGDQAAIAYSRWTAGGTVCAGTLVRLAAALGVTATVQESLGCICGSATCDSEVAPAGTSFMFVVTLPKSNVTNCECGVATCDDSLGTSEPSLAECPIAHAAPLHTLPVFSYTGI